MMWAKFFADMDLMAQGIDEGGNPLYVDDEGNQWKGILLFGFGDLEQVCVSYGAKHYNEGHEMCGWCDANRITKQYTNLQEDAEWRLSAKTMTNDVFAINSLAVQNTIADDV